MFGVLGAIPRGLAESRLDGGHEAEEGDDGLRKRSKGALAAWWAGLGGMGVLVAMLARVARKRLGVE